MKLRGFLAALVSIAMLASCSNIGKKMAECYVKSDTYVEHDECVRTVTLGPIASRKIPSGDMISFWNQGDRIKYRYENNELTSTGASAALRDLCTVYEARERAQNAQTAQIFAAALLVGAAAYAASKNSGGGGYSRSCYSDSPAYICRQCTMGKACGNSCISVTDSCYQPPGCACNAY